MMIKEYESKREEIITATVQKVDPTTGNITLDTGTSYATLLKTEQIPGEEFMVGDHIKVFVMEVRKEAEVLSLTFPEPIPVWLRDSLSLRFLKSARA